MINENMVNVAKKNVNNMRDKLEKMRRKYEILMAVQQVADSKIDMDQFMDLNNLPCIDAIHCQAEYARQMEYSAFRY